MFKTIMLQNSATGPVPELNHVSAGLGVRTKQLVIIFLAMQEKSLIGKTKKQLKITKRRTAVKKEQEAADEKSTFQCPGLCSRQKI